MFLQSIYINKIKLNPECYSWMQYDNDDADTLAMPSKCHLISTSSARLVACRSFVGRGCRRCTSIRITIGVCRGGLSKWNVRKRWSAKTSAHVWIYGAFPWHRWCGWVFCVFVWAQGCNGWSSFSHSLSMILSLALVHRIHRCVRARLYAASDPVCMSVLVQCCCFSC